MITSSLRPLAAPTVTETSWLVPNLLPAGDIVLLEAAAGVGKTLLAAAWLAKVSKEGQGSVAGLVVTASTRAAELAAAHLARHEANFDRLKNIHWAATSRDENGRREAVVEAMNTHLADHLEAHKPQLLVIDALEEVLVELASEPTHRQRHFWDCLRKDARRHGCTVLLLSRPCTRRDRAGRVGRLAADYARCCYTLAWHPTDAAQRVLTRTRDPLAPTGAQWHVGIDGDGKAECFTAPDNDHVPPGQGSAPVTWLTRRQKSDNVPRILKELEAYVGIKMPVFMVREHILGQGFSYSAFREALRHSDIKHKREGGVWWYVPGPDHTARNRAIYTKRLVVRHQSKTADGPAPKPLADRPLNEQPWETDPILPADENMMMRITRKLNRIINRLTPAENAAFQAGDRDTLLKIANAQHDQLDEAERSFLERREWERETKQKAAAAG